MEIKSNDATINRPDGERAIDAPAVLVHLREYGELIKTEKAWQQGDRNAITVFKSDGMTIVLTRLKAGASMDKIQTQGFSSLLVTEGKIKSQSGEVKECEAGDLMVFHPSVDFTITAETEATILLTHYSNKPESNDPPNPTAEHWAGRN